MEKLRWMRVLGDTIFATGILALGYFLLGLVTGWSLVKQEAPKEGTSTPPPPLDDPAPMSLPPNTLRGAP